MTPEASDEVPMTRDELVQAIRSAAEDAMTFYLRSRGMSLAQIRYGIAAYAEKHAGEILAKHPLMTRCSLTVSLPPVDRKP